MNRRHFTMGLAALFGAPKVPVATPNVALSGAAVQHMQVATIITRAHNNCSLPFLMRHLKVSEQVAVQLQSELVSRKIITMPAANGISQAIDPIQAHKLPQAVRQPSVTGQSQSKIKDSIKEKLSAAHEGDGPDPSDDQADDPIPTRHRDADEIPSYVIAPNDRGGEDLV